MRLMILKNGVVDNIAIFEDESSLPEEWGDWAPVPEGVAIGSTDNGDGSFNPPKNQSED